ncbi:MAG: RimK/LysX family protein [Nanoarchaeota archaeon]
MAQTDKPILGLVEVVDIRGNNADTQSLKARIDTGAQNSSIDLVVAQELRLGPIIKTKSIRNSHGQSLRPVVKARVVIAGKELEGEFTIANRSNMRYKLLVGQNLLKQGFLIDPSKDDQGK